MRTICESLNLKVAKPLIARPVVMPMKNSPASGRGHAYADGRYPASAELSCQTVAEQAGDDGASCDHHGHRAGVGYRYAKFHVHDPPG